MMNKTLFQPYSDILPNTDLYAHSFDEEIREIQPLLDAVFALKGHDKLKECFRTSVVMETVEDFEIG